ncbi:MAG: sugar ABC transporter permease [Spirochaetales bacterium]|jgi:multiple sugar transport system permease protein|nr:sugar ABC transporter permease [Spirochaetales bacterium]
MVLRKSTLMSQARYEAYSAWLFAAPALILLSLFLIGPFFMSLGLAFTDLRLISPLPTEFIGFRNFVRLFSDTVFFKSIGNNFKFVLIVVPVQTTLALLLAIMVDKTRRFSNVFRMIYFMPVVVPMIVVSVIWYFMYNPSIGLINKGLSFISFGVLGKSLWLEGEKTALPAIMILSTWQGVGFQMVIYLAGLQDIPQSLYEAATVDGSSPWHTFWYITLPQLRNTTIFIVISTTILAFQLFTQVKVMTNGGPNDATSTTVLYIYNQGFKNLKVGYASAVSVVFILIVLVISLVQRKYLKSNREVG